MSNNQTILLTGATGFLGSHVLEMLLFYEYNVVVLKRSTSDTWRISKLKDKVVFYDTDVFDLSNIFETHHIDIVIHLATLYKKFEEPTDIKKMIVTNISFPSELLVLANKYGVKGFINTGTFFEYDCSRQPVSEKTELKPFNFYAKTKIAFEHILKTYSQNICINTLKLFSPFGEKDNLKLVPFIIKKGINNEEISLSQGFQKIDLIYSKDVAEAYAKVIERMVKIDYQPEYEVFNIGNGFPLSIREIATIIEESIGSRLKINWGEKSLNDIPLVYADTRKSKDVLGWSPKYSHNVAISNTVNYYNQ